MHSHQVMNYEDLRDDRLRLRLDQLTDDLLRRVIDLEPSVREGVVQTVGPPPYRRLDCDGRALAYVRLRPRKVAVRMDISGLWLSPGSSRLEIPSSTGPALLLLCRRDVEEAALFAVAAVRRTRSRQERHHARVPLPRYASA